MEWSDKRVIVADSDVLGEPYLPSVIHARETHLNQMKSCLMLIAEARKPINCWLHGNSGTGKTVTARSLLRKLEDTAGIRSVYVNCWEYPTFFSLLEQVAIKLNMLAPEKLSTSFKLERLKRHISDDRMVLVLDEIDKPPPKERNTILYNFSGIPTIGLVCICNSQHAYFDLEDRVKSRLNPTRIFFEGYPTDELVKILDQRAQYALTGGTFTPELLQAIADLADGDARIGIQTLKDAACFAEAGGHDRIEVDHVRRAWNSAKDLSLTHQLRSLSDHHRLLYELIKKNPGIRSGNLWRLYLRTCGARSITPIAIRTYSDYCNTLVALELVESKRATVPGKVREFSAMK
jgi:orc1/cdc6 family replication initiation protein